MMMMMGSGSIPHLRTGRLPPARRIHRGCGSWMAFRRQARRFLASQPEVRSAGANQAAPGYVKWLKAGGKQEALRA